MYVGTRTQVDCRVDLAVLHELQLVANQQRMPLSRNAGLSIGQCSYMFM